MKNRQVFPVNVTSLSYVCQEYIYLIKEDYMCIIN